VLLCVALASPPLVVAGVAVSTGPASPHRISIGFPAQAQRYRASDVNGVAVSVQSNVPVSSWSAAQICLRFDSSPLHCTDAASVLSGDVQLPTNVGEGRHSLELWFEHDASIRSRAAFEVVSDQRRPEAVVQGECSEEGDYIRLPVEMEGSTFVFTATPCSLRADWHGSLLNATASFCHDNGISFQSCTNRMVQAILNPADRRGAWAAEVVASELAMPAHSFGSSAEKHHLDFSSDDFSASYSGVTQELDVRFSSTEGHLLSSNPEKVQCIQLALSLVQATSMMEIGFNIGHSLAAVVGAVPSIKYFLSFDICDKPDAPAAFAFLQDKFKDRDLRLVCGDSTTAVPTYAVERTYDLIHIDGGHDYATALKDITNCRRFSSPRTVLVIDDTGPDEAGVLNDYSNEVNMAIKKAVSSGIVEFIAPGLCQQGQAFLRYIH
jgi:predicted O-methyltransferase YrrM